MAVLSVLKNFANSEKAVATGLLVIAATVMVFLNKITVAEWMDYTQVLAGIYVGGKAVQGAASAMSGGSAAKAELAKLKDAIAKNDAKADGALVTRFPTS